MATYDEQGDVWRDGSGRAYNDRGIAELNRQSDFTGQSSGGAGDELLGEIFGSGKKKKQQTPSAPVISGPSYKEVISTVDYGIEIVNDDNFQGYPQAIDRVLHFLAMQNMVWAENSNVQIG